MEAEREEARRREEKRLAEEEARRKAEEEEARRKVRRAGGRQYRLWRYTWGGVRGGGRVREQASVGRRGVGFASTALSPTAPAAAARSAAALRPCGPHGCAQGSVEEERQPAGRRANMMAPYHPACWPACLPAAPVQAEEEARLAEEAAAKLALLDPDVAALRKLLDAGKSAKEVSRGRAGGQAGGGVGGCLGGCRGASEWPGSLSSPALPSCYRCRRATEERRACSCVLTCALSLSRGSVVLGARRGRAGSRRGPACPATSTPGPY